MSKGGTNATGTGNQINQELNSISTTGNDFNTQLQGILGNAVNSPVASAGSTAAGNLSSLAATGGAAPASQANLTSIAQSGGYTPAQITSMEDQASQAAQSSYSTAGDAYNRSVSASGGYGPSAGAEASLARQGSQAASTATENVLGQIAQNQVGNQLSANTGLTNIQQNLTGNQLTANSGLNQLAGLSQTQIQNLLSTILGNFSTTAGASNQTIGIGENLAVAPSATTIASQNISSILGSLSSNG